jgi:MFS family permease
MSSASDGSSRSGSSRSGSSRSGSRWVVLAVVLLGNFASGVVFTLLSVARKEIALDLGTTQALVLWSFTGPTLAGAVCGPALGRYGDLIGHRRMYVLALFGGLLTSIAVSLSWNVGSLIAFRAVGAAITAALGPSSLALIFRAFEREDRVKAMGYWSLVGAGAPVIGVVIGGPLVEALGWRSMFAAQIPCYVVAVIAAQRYLPETARRELSRFDLRGAVLLGSTTLLLLLAVNRGPAWGWTSAKVLGCFAVVPFTAAAFVWWQRRCEHPLLQLSLFKKRNVAAGIGAQMLAQFSYIGAGLILVNDILVSRPGFGYSLAEASRTTIARPIVFAAVAPFAAYLAVKVGERVTAAFGMAAIALSMLLLLVTRPGSSIVVLVIAIGVSGLGMGVSSPSLSTSVANAVPESRLGAIGAAQQMLIQSASVIGTQVLVTVARSGEGPATVGGYRLAFTIALLVALAAVACASLLRRAKRN